MRANLAVHVNESMLDDEAMQGEDDTIGVFKKTTFLHVKRGARGLVEKSRGEKGL